MSQDIIKISGQSNVATAPTRPDVRTRVLKHGDSFAVFDRYGDIQSIGTCEQEQGLYYEDTRFLSHLELLFADGTHPLLLNSTITEDNSLLVVDMTNPEFYENDSVVVPKDTIHIFRSKLLWEGVCYEHLRIVNYGASLLDIPFVFKFAADFSDIFEVRGAKRDRKGRRLPDEIGTQEVIFNYQGLDQITRRTRLRFSPSLTKISASALNFNASLPPGVEKEFYFTVSCESAGEERTQENYEPVLAKVVSAIKKARERDCQILTSNEQFNDWLSRSYADLHMLITKTPEGLYPYAGVPWFSTPFGRDGIITALQSLWVNPEIAKGVLAYLAANQARELNPDQEAEPGKILHEIRKGEMARCGEIAFERYYGTADATPLFVMLAGEYYKRTGDNDFIETIWGNIEKALGWIENYGDMDGDGFVEYARHTAKGLVQQGWKDSDDSIFHADGSLAHGPIALCEVQGYVYAAWRNAAELAKITGKTKMAEDLDRQADELKERFNRAFWCEEISTYAIALDGDKRQCRVRSSNAGHALFTGIATPEYARQLGETLLDKKNFSGWGVRTIAKAEANYNPMAYHNGSVWPHDNALIAMGLSRYGLKSQAMEIMTGLFDASIVLDLHRLPELFCGFVRRSGQGPTQYPVACMPQAWAATSVFFFLQACLGLSFERKNTKICFNHPQLPDYLEWVEIKNLGVDHSTVDLRLRRHTQNVGIDVLRKEGDVEITAIV